MTGDPKSTNIMAEPLRLKELVAYQSGAVVSRTLIDEDHGTVTVFAFDESQGLSEHRAPFNALLIVIDGEMEVAISGKHFNLVEGQMIIMPANEPHALKATMRSKIILVMIRT